MTGSATALTLRASALGVLAIALGASALPAAGSDRLPMGGARIGGPQAGDPTGRPDSPAHRALERTVVHGRIETQRAARTLREIDRRANDAAALRASPARVRPARGLRLENESERSQESLRLDRDIAELDRILSERDLGPTTRSVLQSYRRELDAERTRLSTGPEVGAR